MGNNKSLYKSYFTELNLYNKPASPKDKLRTQSQLNATPGLEGDIPNQPISVKESSSGSSRRTPESSLAIKQTVPNQLLSFQLNQTSVVTIDPQVTGLQKFNVSQNAQPRQLVKTFKIKIDENQSLSINIPEKLSSTTEEGVTVLDQQPTCGWLMEQVEIKYAQLINQKRRDKQNKTQKMRKKIIVALKTVDQNENIDFWLTQYSRTLKALPNGLQLEAHYTKVILNKAKMVCINDFELLKVIGKGGFSKVYMVRKKDTGFMFAMKVMKKSSVTNDSKLRDLKPENVLIDIDGHIKLADFGLSKIFKLNERSFSFCGSPEYMCPEILKREGHNHMVDYYTLGAILFEMLTGLPPYYTNNKGEMTKRILETELNYPDHLNSDVVDLMKGLLIRNPLRRLGSQNGIEEIKQQEWCKGIDWDSITAKKIAPPWKPRLDQSNFDPEYTNLPLNFDEKNFKRALQGDREFSFYYESPCQSLTVTDHSIYCSASNSDLVTLQSPLISVPSQAYMDKEILLNGGSSMKLIDHFRQSMEMPNGGNRQSDLSTKLQQELMLYVQGGGQDRSSILFTQTMFEEAQQQQLISMNLETAIRINQNLIRDESKISLEYNEESGFTNFRGFSFFGESQDERQVKIQLIKYTKMKNKLNKRLKKIQDEFGTIKRQDLQNISISSPDSSLNSSFANQTVLPTPPVIDDGPSSRNSNPSASQPYSKQQSQNMQDNQSSGSSPQPIFSQIKSLNSAVSNANSRGGMVIDKKQKQQMIFNKLQEAKSFVQAKPSPIDDIQDSDSLNKAIYKSFQTTNNNLVISQPQQPNFQKSKIFSGPVDNPFGAYSALSQQHHNDYLDNSLRDESSIEESVAEERKQFKDDEDEIRSQQIQYNSMKISNQGGRFSMGSPVTHNFKKAGEKQKVNFQIDNKMSYQELNRSLVYEESKDIEVPPSEESSQDVGIYNGDSKGVKILLFQNQNVSKSSKKVDKNIRDQLKSNKIVVTQRNRNTKTSLGAPQSGLFNRKSTINQQTNLSNNTSNNTTTNSKIQQMIHNAQHQQQSIANSSNRASSRDNYDLQHQVTIMTQLSEQKSISEKTNAGIEYISTKHTYGDLHSIKSSLMKKTFQNSDQLSQSFQESQVKEGENRNLEQHIGGGTSDSKLMALLVSRNNNKKEKLFQQSPNTKAPQQEMMKKSETQGVRTNSKSKPKEVVRKIQIPIKRGLEIDIRSPSQTGSPERIYHHIEGDQTHSYSVIMKREEKLEKGEVGELSGVQSQQQTPKGAPQQFQFGAKKISIHQKQASLDCASLNHSELFSIKIEGKSDAKSKQYNKQSTFLKAQGNVNNLKNTGGKQYCQTKQGSLMGSPSSQSSIMKFGQFGPSPKAQFHKNIIIGDDTFDSKCKQETDDDQDCTIRPHTSANNSQNGKKMNTTNFTNSQKKDSFTKVSNSKVVNQKVQPTLKKGTQATNSTIGFLKQDQQLLLNSMLSTRSTLQKNINFNQSNMKPPVGKVHEGTVGSINTQSGLPASKKQVFQSNQVKQNNISNFNNTTLGNNTPSGSKLSLSNAFGTNNLKAPSSQSLASQPTSAKNSLSQKFTFPQQQSIEGLISPRKNQASKLNKHTINLQQSFPSKQQTSSSLQSNSHNASILMSKGAEPDYEVPKKMIEPKIKMQTSDSNVNSQQEEGLMAYQPKTLPIGNIVLKPPKTSTHKNSSNKGFFS